MERVVTDTLVIDGYSRSWAGDYELNIRFRDCTGSGGGDSDDPESMGE